jgi:hypothetical protein
MTTKTRTMKASDLAFPDTAEGRLMRRCDTYARRGILHFAAPGEIQIRGRHYRGRFGSRVFRAAVEILTRRRSCLRSIKETRKGKPYDVILDCPNCRREAEARGWLRDPSHCSVTEWPADEADAEGECTGCGARRAQSESRRRVVRPDLTQGHAFRRLLK